MSYLKPLKLERKMIDDFERTFFRADPDSIKLIRVNTGKGPIDIVRTSSGWLVAGRYRADEGTLERLLEVISQGRLIKIVGDGTERWKFGFDDPAIVISIGFDENRADVIEIAGKNPAGTGHYAYARSLGKVFLVNDEFAREMRLNLYELRDKKVFPFVPDGAYSLKIKGSGNDLNLVKDNRGWSMKKPFDARCDSEAVDGFMSSLSIYRARGFLPWNDKYLNLKKIDLNINDKEASSLIDAEVYFWGSQGDRGVLARRSGSDEATQSGRDLWNILNANPSRFLVRELFDIDRAFVEKILVTWSGKQYIFEKGRGGWTENGKQIRSDLVDQLVEFLLSWKARKLVEAGTVSGKVKMVIEIVGGGKNSKVTISDMNMDREVSPTGLMLPEGENMESFRKVDFFLASSTALELSPIVSSLDIEKISSITQDIEK